MLSIELTLTLETTHLVLIAYQSCQAMLRISGDGDVADVVQYRSLATGESVKQLTLSREGTHFSTLFVSMLYTATMMSQDI